MLSFFSPSRSSFLLFCLLLVAVVKSQAFAGPYIDTIANSTIRDERNSSNPYYGTSVSLSNDGFYLAAGAPFPPSTPGKGYWEWLVKNSTTTFFKSYGIVTFLPQIEYWGSRLSVSENGDKLASPTFQISYWTFKVTWWNPPDFPDGSYAQMPTCTDESSSVEVALGANSAVSSCNSNVTYWAYNELQHTVAAAVWYNQLEFHELSMTTFEANQLSCATSSTSLRVRRQASQTSWTDFASFVFANTQPYLQADCFGDSFVVGEATSGVSTRLSVYKWYSNGSAAAVNRIEIQGTVGDLSLGNDIMAITLPATGELWIFQSLDTASVPCLKTKIPWSDQSNVLYMPVSVGSNMTTGVQTIVVGAVSQNTSIPGSVYTLINPCIPPPPSTSMTSSATTTTAITATTSTVGTTIATTATIATSARTSTIATKATTATTASTATATATATTTTTAVTTTGGAPTAVCTSNLNISIGNQAICSNGTWIVPGDVSNNGVIVVSGSDNVQVGGNLTLNSQSELEIVTNTTDRGSLVQAGGDVQLGGALTVVITSRPNRPVIVPVINGTSIRGKFDSIQVEQTFPGSKCYNTTQVPTYTATSVQLLITTTKKSSCGSKALIIGVAVGVSLALIVIIVIAAFIAILLYQKLHKPVVVVNSESLLT